MNTAQKQIEKKKNNEQPNRQDRVDRVHDAVAGRQCPQWDLSMAADRDFDSLTPLRRP